MQSAQRKAAEDVIFVIGEGVHWLTKNEVVMAGKIIAPCNANGDARILDAGGNTHLINKAWICRHRGDSPTASELPIHAPRAQTEPRPFTRLSGTVFAEMQAIERGQKTVRQMQSMRDASEAMEAAAKMAELTKANALLLAEIQRATVERDALRAGTPGGPGGTKALLVVTPPPDTPGTEISPDDDVAPGDAEMLQAGGDNSLSRMTGYVVTAVMLILTMVALAGSVSCVAIAVGMSKIVGHASYAVLHVGGLRNITADGSGGDVDLPRISDVRQWMHTDPVLFAFVTVITFFAACYINSMALGNFWRVRRVFRSVATHAARHVGVIVAFIFIGFVLSRADAISDSEVVQFQKFVASHQDQPVVMNYFRVASQLSANWTNTVILPDYDRIDILINAEAGDDKCSWSVFDTGAFRHVVNDSRRVVPGSIRPCNISVRGVFGGSGKPPKYMCDAIDTVQTQSGTAELLMQDALMIETCPHPLVAGVRVRAR